jgi:hypothetical protein
MRTRISIAILYQLFYRLRVPPAEADEYDYGKKVTIPVLSSELQSLSSELKHLSSELRNPSSKLKIPSSVLGSLSSELSTCSSELNMLSSTLACQSSELKGTTPKVKISSFSTLHCLFLLNTAIFTRPPALYCFM